MTHADIQLLQAIELEGSKFKHNISSTKRVWNLIQKGYIDFQKVEREPNDPMYKILGLTSTGRSVLEALH